jgi:hypothetical protein
MVGYDIDVIVVRVEKWVNHSALIIVFQIESFNNCFDGRCPAILHEAKLIKPAYYSNRIHKQHSF